MTSDVGVTAALVRPMDRMGKDNYIRSERSGLCPRISRSFFGMFCKTGRAAVCEC